MASMIKKLKDAWERYQIKRVEEYNDAVWQRASEVINIREVYEPLPDEGELGLRQRCIVVLGVVAYVEKPSDKRELLDLLQEARQLYFLTHCKHPKRKLS